MRQSRKSTPPGNGDCKREREREIEMERERERGKRKREGEREMRPQWERESEKKGERRLFVPNLLPLVTETAKPNGQITSPLRPPFIFLLAFLIPAPSTLLGRKISLKAKEAFSPFVPPKWKERAIVVLASSSRAAVAAVEIAAAAAVKIAAAAVVEIAAAAASVLFRFFLLSALTRAMLAFHFLRSHLRLHWINWAQATTVTIFFHFICKRRVPFSTSCDTIWKGPCLVPVASPCLSSFLPQCRWEKKRMLTKRKPM